MVMALYAVAELIEAKSVDRARHAIAGLLDLSPRRPRCAKAMEAGSPVPWTTLRWGGGAHSPWRAHSA